MYVLMFARPDNPVYGLDVTGNRICTIALFFIGFNIFASGMFTALETVWLLIIKLICKKDKYGGLK